MSESSILKITQLNDTSDQTVALDALFDSLKDALVPETLADLQEAVILREETSPTYLENSLAVPHGRIHSLDHIVVSVGLNARGIDWPVEESKARIIILVGVPSPMVTGYLKILQKIIKWHRWSPLVREDGSIDPAHTARLKQELEALLA